MGGVGSGEWGVGGRVGRERGARREERESGELDWCGREERESGELEELE